MSLVTDAILLDCAEDWTDTVRVENVIRAYGRPVVEPVRPLAEAAVRELVEAGLVVIGHPTSGPERFQVWSPDPTVSLEMLAKEWDSGRLERCESFAWLNLTPAGEREAERLQARRDRCEEAVIDELCRRHPELVAGIDSSAESLPAWRLLNDLAGEAVEGKSPPWRAPLSPEVLGAVAALVDDVYVQGDTGVREVVLDRFVRAHVHEGVNNEPAVSRLGPVLRRVVEDHDAEVRRLLSGGGA